MMHSRQACAHSIKTSSVFPVVNAAAEDFRLKPNSPCINTGAIAPLSGTPSVDAVGAARVVGGRIDMGAYENPEQHVMVHAGVGKG